MTLNASTTTNTFSDDLMDAVKRIFEKNLRTNNKGVAITLSININTLGKEGEQSYQLLLQGKDDPEEPIVLPVFVEGFVVPAIQVSDTLLTMKSYPQFPNTLQKPISSTFC